MLKKENAKTKERKQVIDYLRKVNGNITLKELGKKFGISCSKVSQIITFAIEEKMLKQK